MKRKTHARACFLVLLLSGCLLSHAQMITGVWSGKINRQKVEVKIILNGDSLTGTSYYYENPTHYSRYTIKGYFDPESNDAVWWDDQLVEERAGNSRKYPMLSRADFNCPGSGKMMLDGKTGRRGDDNPQSDVHLDKTGTALFADEWDYVIDNYLTGANDPEIIDSVTAIAYEQRIEPEPVAVAPPRPVQQPVIVKEQPAPKEEKTIAPPPTIEEKFTNRKKVFVKEIPVSGDSIELRFYDNAEIDGDSISLFLNDKLVFQHIRLLATPYTIKLAVKDLHDTNELVMVAENLGTIPPNTAYMVCEIDGTRYDAHLESTEGSSAEIRFIKASSKSQ